MNTMTELKVGDWVKYKHISGLEIIGIVRVVTRGIYTVRDWLGSVDVTKKQIIEVRPQRK